MPTDETTKATPTVVVRIPAALWDRCGRLAERLGASQAQLGIDTPSRASVLRAALDAGLNALGQRIKRKAKGDAEAKD